MNTNYIDSRALKLAPYETRFKKSRTGRYKKIGILEEEFLVIDARRVQEFVEKYIGVESEILDSENNAIMIYDLTIVELKAIWRFIDDKDLWREQLENDDGEYNGSDYPMSYIENV